MAKQSHARNSLLFSLETETREKLFIKKSFLIGIMNEFLRRPRSLIDEEPIQPMPNHRYHEIDFIKFVSILIVVYAHSVTTSFEPSKVWYISLARDMGRFSVPALFFTSGFLFTKGDQATGQIIKKKLLRILPPYFFCSTCIQVLNLPKVSTPLEQLSMKQFVLNLIAGDTIGIYYYIFVLFYLYAFSLVIRRLPLKWVWGVWLISLLCLWLFIENIYIPPLMLNYIVPNSIFSFLMRHPFYWVFPYMTGWMVSLYYQKIYTFLNNKANVAILLSAFLVVMSHIYADVFGGGLRVAPILNQITIYLKICLLFCIGLKMTKSMAVIRYLSDNMYGIYLVHFPIAKSVQAALTDFSVNYHFISTAISWATGIALSLVIIHLFKKVGGRYSVYFVGS